MTSCIYMYVPPFVGRLVVGESLGNLRMYLLAHTYLPVKDMLRLVTITMTH